MKSSDLLYSFDNEQLNEILAGMISIFETVFPDRIRAYYVIGSYLDGTQLSTSDIDGYVIFKDNIDFEEYKKTMELLAYCSQLSPIALDFAPRPENSLKRHGVVDLKLASEILYGEDIRDELTVLDVSIYTISMMADGLQLIKALRRDLGVLTYPLGYPDADDELYGYAQRLVNDADGNAQQSTKSLMNVIGKPATAIIMHKTKQHVKSKRDAVQRYQSDVADEWASLVRDVYEKCRNEWHYLIPEDETQRQTLRTFCQRILEFENHFLHTLRNYLLDILHSDESASGWLTFMEVPMLLGIAPDVLQPAIEEGHMQMREVEGESQVLIEEVHKLLAMGVLDMIVFPDDEELQEILRKLTKAENVLLQKFSENALQKQFNIPSQ